MKQEKIPFRLEVEAPRHYSEAEHVIREAFWNLHAPGCDEHYLAHVLRKHPDYLPGLSLVALAGEGAGGPDGEEGERVLGSIMYATCRLEGAGGERAKAVTFGPVAVHPDYQGRGVGAALIRSSLALAKEAGHEVVVILGYPHDYCRHGFRNGLDLGVSDSTGGHPFGLLVRELKEGALAGVAWRCAFSAAYDFDPAEALAYDAGFPPKAREWRPSQEEFAIAVRARLDPGPAAAGDEGGA